VGTRSGHKLSLLKSEGYIYTSSSIADDFPYYVVDDEGRSCLLNLPFHYVMDDAMYFHFSWYGSESAGQRLMSHGVRPDAQPDKFVSAEIARTLVNVNDMAGKRILCPRADIASQGLIDDLEGFGAKVTQVAAYRTVPEDAGRGPVGELLRSDRAHWITFTSSSTVRNFFKTIDPHEVRSASVRLASIGPVTSGRMRELGVEPTVQAEYHTVSGLVEAILVQENASRESP